MKKIACSVLFVLFSLSLFADTWVDIQSPVPQPAQIQLMSSNIQSSVIHFSFTGFFMEEVKTDRGTAYTLSLANATPILSAQDPDMLKLTTSVIIPDMAAMDVRIVSSNYVDFPNILIAPSKGNLLRNVDPARIPFVFGNSYQVDQFYPGTQAGLREPHIIRDLRGQTVIAYPFQYNPVTMTLRVYYDMIVEVFRTENAPVNPLVRHSSEILVDQDFLPLYQRQFLNFNDFTDYTPLNEQGKMLIISHGSFMSAMQSFINWKKRSGRQCQIVDIATVGTTPAAIKSYIANYYNTNGLTYVLLVGDHAQIPTDQSTGLGGPSDNSYSYIVGSDHYPDIFVGRFSAETVAHVNTQVTRSIQYEKNPQLTSDNWYTTTIGIASSEGPGDDNEYDYQHIRNLQTQQLAYTYTYNYELFDGSQGGNDATGNPTPAMVSSAVNDGGSNILYTGHGSTTSWSTSGFSNTNVNALLNQNKLPFIWSVACVNGSFLSTTCFAESWLRAENGGNPIGAVGFLGSTINQSWNPPMEGHDEMVAILVESYSGNIKRTFGGLSMNGCMKMNDTYGTGGNDMTDTWTVFGDPSLMVRTDNPQIITASHVPSLFVGATNLSLTCNVNGALAAASLNNEILGTAYVAGGSATITFSSALTIPGDTVKLVITAYNGVPYLASIPIIPASGPYVVYHAHTLSDPTPGGNNNSLMDFGEINLLSVTLKNIGIEQATNVVATLSTTNPNITITDNTENYGNIDPNQTVLKSNAFALNVANNIPDQQVVTFNLNAASGTNNWSSQFNVTANAPVLAIGTMSISDPAPGGNNNGILDPGETANLVIVTTNNGHAAVGNVNATLAIVGGSSPYLTINNSTFSVGTLSIGGSVNATFSVTANASTPVGTPVDLTCTLAGGVSGQYTASSPKQVVIGLIPTYIIANTTVNTCVGNFYDSGGASGNYQNNENFTMTFYPAVSGNMVRAVFSAFSTESGYDYLKIYNGTSTSAALIGSYHGTTSPGTITASNTSGALTFNFTSDVTVTSTGWVAAISCYNSSVPPVAEFNASNTSPAVNTTVTLTDQSTNIPTAWNWSITPGTYNFMGGTNSTSQNPQIQFTATGYYSISLTASNAYGTSSITKTNFINVINCSYCASTSNNATEEWISNVTFNTINNSSGGTTGYQNFTSISTSVLPGSTHSLAVTCGQIGTYTEHSWAFFDWNQDCDFTDTGEAFDLGQVSGAGTMTTNITIPAGATPGSTRMRVSLKYSADPTSCETFSYGQVEDYTVIVGGGTLAVTPSNRAVSENAGSTTFSVTSSASWTASSNQTWCTVTPSGSGNGTITANYEQNTSIDPRVATVTVSASGMTPVDVTVSQAAIANITLNLKVYLEGLYNGEGQMRKAQNETGNQFPGNVADQITVQLHESTAPYNQVGTPFLANLNTDGTSQVIVPAIHSGARYIAISHRNSIEIWSAAPVNLVSTPILYDFSLQSTSAYGNNLCHVDPTVYAIFCGDANKDGVVDSMDMGDIDNASGAFMMGYLITDINGDGVIDSNDMASTENNASNFIIVITP